MHVGFRVGGGGGGIGLGHIMRCIAIADAFKKQKIDSTFVCGDYPFALELIESHGFPVYSVQTKNLQTDLKQTLKLLQAAEIIVADDYDFPSEYLKGLSSFGQCVVCIDDKMDRELPVDMVLANPYANKSDYEDKISSHTQLLCGPNYIPLRKEYCHAKEHKVSESIQKVLITFGGEDAFNVTQKILKALHHRKDLMRIVLVGGAYRFYDKLKKELEASESPFELHQNMKNVMPLQQKADVAITAAGTTVWELAAVGTPMILIQAVDNQSGTVKYVSKHHMGMVLGFHTRVGELDILAALEKLENKKLRQEYAEKCQHLIDGKGSEHIVEAVITRFEKTKIQLRKVVDKDPENLDSKLIWKWRNNPVTREMSRNSDWIPWKLHRDWYVKTMDDPKEVLLIADFHERPVGTVRFDLSKGHSAEVSININPKMRGKGLGKKLLGTACRYAFHKLGLRKIDAEIKEKNVSSIHIFESVGFEFIEKVDGIQKYVMVMK